MKFLTQNLNFLVLFSFSDYSVHLVWPYPACFSCLLYSAINYILLSIDKNIYCTVMQSNLLGGPGTVSGGEGKSKRRRKKSVKKSRREREEGAYLVLYHFSLPFRLSLAPANCPWISDDVESNYSFLNCLRWSFLKLVIIRPLKTSYNYALTFYLISPFPVFLVVLRKASNSVFKPWSICWKLETKLAGRFTHLPY